MSGSLYGQANAAAAQYGVPQQLFTDVIGAESGFNPNAYNPSSGATGIAQFLPSTAANAGYGVAPFDPTDAGSSLNAAAQYLAGLYQRFGSWTGALNAYSGNSAGGAPYAGNNGQGAILSDLEALGENPGVGGGGTGAGMPGTSTGTGSGMSTTAATAVDQPSGQSCGLSPVCWLSAGASFLGGYATRAALIVVGVIFLLGALYLFATRTQAVAQAA